MTLQQQRGQRGRQREGIERGDDRRDRDGQRELPVELAGQARHERERDEHAGKRQRDRDDRRAHFLHREIGRILRRQPPGDIALDVFHHHDRVVDDDPDRQHHPEQRQRVDRESEHEQQREGADNRNGHRQQRNDGGAPGLQKQDDDDHDQRDRFEQRGNHGGDAGAHELGRIENDPVIDAGGHVRLDFRHRLPDLVRNRQRVSAGRLKDAEPHCGFAVDHRSQAVVRCAELDVRDVAQIGHASGLCRLDHDGAEFIFRLQSSSRIDGQLQRHVAAHRLRTDHPGRDLHVLLANRVDHIGRGQPACRDLLRIEPDPHRIVSSAPDSDFADAGNTLEPALYVQYPVVAKIVDVVAIVRRNQMHGDGLRGGRFDGRHAEPLHIGGKLRECLRDPVLHQLLRLVRIGADLEGDRERQIAVAVRLRLHIEHALDAVDLLFERRSDGLGDHLRVRARVLRIDGNHRRHHLGVLRDRQEIQRYDACQQDQCRQDAGENRPVHEKPRNVHDQVSIILDWLPRRRAAGVEACRRDDRLSSPRLDAARRRSKAG
ncbi:hypothetical protein BUB20358_06688 [Burkholderia ubonensis]|nr:hypothetical protein BUB20358_06688 [Burkholderia ubonensis]